MKPAASARMLRPTPRNLRFLAARLRAGELVAIPTETVYGLAANALDARACARIFRAKGRPAQDPLIVHVHHYDQLETIARTHPAAARLARRFWPGPLTMVLPKKDVVPAVVTAGRDSVAVRMPAHPVARRLLALAAIPLAAPSANPFGYISPTAAEHVRQGLGRKIKYILDGGSSSIGLESTIIDLRDPDAPTLLRPGAITKQQLERALGRRVRLPQRAPTSAAGADDSAQAQLAPGMLKRHYSPRTPVVLHARLGRTRNALPHEAFLFLKKPARSLQTNEYWLDGHGNLRGVARRLFATLRRLDTMNLHAIHVELARGGGLADAINDRLRRAAAR
jgi:L-threonylcarbamoyladenylate synthase